MLELINISKIYKHNHIALDNISMTINNNDFLAVVGESGAGKSTLLNIIGGILKPSYGKYMFSNKQLKYTAKAMADFRRTNIGFITQNYALISDMTAFDNIALPLRYCKVKKDEIIRRVKRMADSLNILSLINKQAGQLSGGEAQRVAIARALINNPKLVVADEPTASLDDDNKQRVLDILHKIYDNDTSLIIATHDKDVAKQCNRVIKLVNGRIV